MPVIVIVPTLKFAEPVFVIVKTCVGLVAAPISTEPKALVVGVIAISAAEVAVPERLAVSVGLSGSFDDMDMLAVFAPVVVGSNVTVIVLVAPAAMAWPDALSADFANWAASVLSLIHI